MLYESCVYPHASEKGCPKDSRNFNKDVVITDKKGFKRFLPQITKAASIAF